jgi:peroxiredoxin
MTIHISAALLALAAGAGAEEALEAAAKVSGRDVEVLVRHADGRPAEGVRVRLLYGRQFVVAAARTDAQGRCLQNVAQPGAYEAVVEATPSGAEIHVPFIVSDTPAPTRFPWLAAALAAVAVFGAATLVGMRKLDGVNARPRRWRMALSVVVFLSVAGGIWSWSLSRQSQVLAAAGPDLAGQARDYLRSQNVVPLSEPLEKLLSEPAARRVSAQAHPLLGRSAPDFVLLDTNLQATRLSDQLARGPVVLVFYYGYHCNHCVGQLFALHDDAAKFRELGAELLAISADPPEATRDRFREYGEFAFPVLFDPGNAAAHQYGVFEPATESTPETLQHGTFIIGRDCRVHWAYFGKDPFTDNRALLLELAALEGKLPAEKKP